MIKPERYLSSLLPTFEKGRITDTISKVREDFTERTIPLYERSEKAFTNDNILRLPKALESDAKSLVPRYKSDIVAALTVVLKKVPAKLNICEKLVEEHFSNMVNKETMTFAKANVLRFVEVLDFTSNYARRLLLAMYVEKAVNNKITEPDLKIQARELEWLESNRKGFFRALEIMDMRDKDLERKFQSIPQLNMIQGSVEETESVIGTAKTDPVSLGFAHHRINPIFHLRVIWENYKDARRRATIEEVNQLELYLLANEGDGKLSPSLKRELEYSKERLLKAKRALKKMEEDAEDEED